MTEPQTLEEQLAALRDAAAARMPARRREIIERMLAELEETHVARALGDGDLAPDFTLPVAGSTTRVTLSELLHERTAVLSFYRGYW